MLRSGRSIMLAAAICGGSHSAVAASSLTSAAAAGAAAGIAASAFTFRRFLAASAASRSAVHLIVEFEVNDLPRFKEAFAPLRAASRAEAGCIQYDLVQQDADSLRFTLIEKWANADALSKHDSSEHFLKYVPMLGKAADVRLRKLQAVDW
mmetsp:Transcript_19422/g.37783  ORF Transcript_19422/g.37783 Transcript_19422/m.37783 type:complete len:151 (+) Transcript_19422:176-628(+)